MTRPTGGTIELVADPATLLVRPRGWHLPERHIRFGDETASGALVDFGLFAFHSGPRLHTRDKGIYLYLPKLEHHLEARLWNEVLSFAEERLQIPAGTFRATVLIETFPAVFQLQEILYELRDHSYGLNAGRWDYIFSVIKTNRADPEFVLPDRTAVTMTQPFMRAYTELLVRTCHDRGTFAMGGMAALIPSRKDPEANERAIAAVREDKRREAGDGFDGTWVAHPDVVAAASEEFDQVLGERPNQIDRLRPDVPYDDAPLRDVAATEGEITEQGLRNNLSVGFQYISFWLGGRGAAAINNMMEDAATAEIARTQIWQWIHHGSTLSDGRTVTRELVTRTARRGDRQDPSARSATRCGSAGVLGRRARCWRPSRSATTSPSSLRSAPTSCSTEPPAAPKTALNPSATGAAATRTASARRPARP